MLYSADIMGAAKPVKKAKEEMIEIGTKKEKKPLSEKQKESLVKMAEGRKRKKEEAAAAANLAIENAREAEEAKNSAAVAVEEKKAASAAKRRANLEAKKALKEKHLGEMDKVRSTATEDAIDEAFDKAFAESSPGVDAVEPPAKKIRIRKPKAPIDHDQPPKWFNNFVQMATAEKSAVLGDNKPKKQIAQESKSAAEEQWKSGLVRDRVQHEVNDHMTRLHDMIFCGRR